MELKFSFWQNRGKTSLAYVSMIGGNLWDWYDWTQTNCKNQNSYIDVNNQNLTLINL